MDEAKTKLIAGMNSRVSLLDEISVFTHSKEGSVPLKDVLQKIYKEFKDDPGVDSKSSPDELRAFLKFILPDFDEERVYVSDIKKMVIWYKAMAKYTPELLTEEKKEPKKKKSEKPAKLDKTEKPVSKKTEKGPKKSSKAKKDK